jgi:hypothetical protein
MGVRVIFVRETLTGWEADDVLVSRATAGLIFDLTHGDACFRIPQLYFDELVDVAEVEGQLPPWPATVRDEGAFLKLRERQQRELVPLLDSIGPEAIPPPAQWFIELVRQRVLEGYVVVYSL